MRRAKKSQAVVPDPLLEDEAELSAAEVPAPLPVPYVYQLTYSPVYTLQSHEMFAYVLTVSLLCGSKISYTAGNLAGVLAFTKIMFLQFLS